MNMYGGGGYPRDMGMGQYSRPRGPSNMWYNNQVAMGQPMMGQPMMGHGPMTVNSSLL